MSAIIHPEYYPRDNEYKAEKVLKPERPVPVVFPQERVQVNGKVYQAAKMGIIGPHPDKPGSFVAYLIAQPEVTVGAGKSTIYASLFNASAHILGALDFYRLQCEGNQKIDPNKGDRIATLQTLAIGALNLATGTTDYQDQKNRPFQQQNALEFIHAPHHSDPQEWDVMLRRLLGSGGLDGIEIQVLDSGKLKEKFAYTIAQIQLPEALVQPFFAPSNSLPVSDSSPVVIPKAVTSHENFAVAHAYVSRVLPRLQATNIDAESLMTKITENALAGESVGETQAASAGIRLRKHR